MQDSWKSMWRTPNQGAAVGYHFVLWAVLVPLGVVGIALVLGMMFYLVTATEKAMEFNLLAFACP